MPSQYEPYSRRELGRVSEGALDFAFISAHRAWCHHRRRARMDWHGSAGPLPHRSLLTTIRHTMASEQCHHYNALSEVCLQTLVNM